MLRTIDLGRTDGRKDERTDGRTDGLFTIERGTKQHTAI